MKNCYFMELAGGLTVINLLSATVSNNSSSRNSSNSSTGLNSRCSSSSNISSSSGCAHISIPGQHVPDWMLISRAVKEALIGKLKRLLVSHAVYNFSLSIFSWIYNLFMAHFLVIGNSQVENLFLNMLLDTFSVD